MIGLANDIYSYKLERTTNQDANNLITILMKEKGFSLQRSVDYVGDQFKSLLDVFNKNEACLPSFDAEGDEALRRYILSTKQSIIGYMHWCFDTHRYFTPEDGDVRRTLIVRLTDDALDERAMRTNTGPENSK
ncbi:hypothetical protein SCHPADRAFT_1000785 [Schizopora paradoxa]|uniref:Terpenoid synthase n=1 Tax=Schizopora paradoxa TaxID=27342 RepID=A0A0H2RV24_9AGAM|nr:hypothetical protein SCHPADRAFT_1000785 [Schizopora paradoxa]